LKNILLKIEYQGTRYKGWQIQPKVITVEETIATVLQRICQCKVLLKASSRTDAGVHARGQVATVLIPEHIPLQRLFFSLNSLLPDDISVLDAVQVPAGFSARKDNRGKRYIYQILNAPVGKALYHDFYHWVRAPLDIEQIQEGCRCFEGTHNFSAFRGKGCQQVVTVKTIQKIGLTIERMSGFSTIRISLEGNGFLKNMVRIIAGSLIDIGKGRLDVGVLSRALTSGKREEAGSTAPAKGLILDEVFFNPDPFLDCESLDRVAL